MDMQKPKGLCRRGEVWWARKDVPVALRARVGVTSLKRSLDTTDLRIAIVRFHRVMAEFEQRLAEARQPDAGLLEGVVIELPPEWQGLRAQPTGPRLPVVLEQWAQLQKPTKNTVDEARRTMGQFIKLNGDGVIAAYTVAHIRAWRDLLDRTKTHMRPSEAIP
jgi:hypothetical protein